MSIAYKGGYKYQTRQDYVHKFPWSLGTPGEYEDAFLWLATDTLIVKAGYAWDGPSGPVWQTKNFMRGSLVHDALYQFMRKGVLDKNVYRLVADQELYRIIREDGMSWIRAKMVYYGVRLFGRYAVLKVSENPVVTAP